MGSLQEGDKQEKHTKAHRSEERFSRNAETDLVCRLLLEKKKIVKGHDTKPIKSQGIAELCHPERSFFFYCFAVHRDLHSFPTRRSSDLWWRISTRSCKSPEGGS